MYKNKSFLNERTAKIVFGPKKERIEHFYKNIYGLSTKGSPTIYIFYVMLKSGTLMYGIMNARYPYLKNN